MEEGWGAPAPGIEPATEPGPAPPAPQIVTTTFTYTGDELCRLQRTAYWAIPSVRTWCVSVMALAILVIGAGIALEDPTIAVPAAAFLAFLVWRAGFAGHLGARSPRANPPRQLALAAAAIWCRTPAAEARFEWAAVRATRRRGDLSVIVVGRQACGIPDRALTGDDRRRLQELLGLSPGR